MKSAKSFLKTALMLTGALILICVCMPEWGVVQVLIVLLVALLAGAQWFLYFYLKKMK